MRFVFVMSRLSHLLLARSVFGVSLLTTLGFFPFQETKGETDWASTLTHDARGNFPDLRPGHATYVYGWSGITAATSEVSFRHGEQQTLVLEAKGRTVGLARILWRFDLSYLSVVNAQTLRPLETHQAETARGKRIETNLKFSDEGVDSRRLEGNRATPTVKDFALENLYDLQSVFLYLRSQPLRDHSVYRMAVYPANSAYVATVT
ncbi:MAG: DUF3108 domain-containing protein, partial [Pseudolabrys sp.]